MPPDFSSKTIDILAKRAAYLCSNPDCRVSTVGPNSEIATATLIGEAAHIYAARPGQARHDKHMTDQARSEIFNAIWLCCNCHRQVDRDAVKYPANLLFLWREGHEQYVASQLGSQTEKVRFELAQHELAQFENYPPLIRRIAYDKPPGWEWSLSAALMRHLNAPLFRKLVDLHEGVCALPLHFLDDDSALNWAYERLNEMGEMIGPLAKIMERFNRAWGAHGEPGDIDEIHHAALLLRDSLAQIVAHEERLQSARASPKFDRIFGLLKNALGSQAEKFKQTPDRLDKIVEMAVRLSEAGPQPEPVVITEIIEFELPDGWSNDFNRAARKLESNSTSDHFLAGVKKSATGVESGCVAALGMGALIFLLIQFL